jgi:signal transduction histidine kinase
MTRRARLPARDPRAENASDWRPTAAQPARLPRPARTDARAAAVRRVLRNRTAWTNEALDASEAETQLEWIRAALDGDTADSGRPVTAAEKTLTCKLLELLRQDLLEWEDRLPAAEMLELMRGIERVRKEIAPASQQLLATRLMGANAADLVVELAHDLRSPLTSIMFLSETLRRGQSGQINDVQRQQLGIVYSAALNLSGIASDLIDLAREDTFLNDDAAVRAPLSIQEVVDSVRSMVAPMAEEKRLNIICVRPEHDLRLGNAVSLGRVLLNLTTNAIKFTERGDVEIIAREMGPNRVEFSVRDTGRGMDAETARRLFEPFHRSRSRTGYHFSETGLGLAICRRLVDIMGGALEVETRAGWGTRFFFELDLPRRKRD